MQITSIEDLFNEIFYEIFDYLNGHDIFQAFSTLNSRFQKLIDHPSYLFTIKFNGSTSEIIYMNNYKQILLQYKHKIISIHWYWTKYNDPGQRRTAGNDRFHGIPGISWKQYSGEWTR